VRLRGQGGDLEREGISAVTVRKYVPVEFAECGPWMEVASREKKERQEKREKGAS
jgi:hypothetical protein